MSRVVIVALILIIDSRKTVHNPLNSSNEQIQGEVQELVIEEWLSNQFPLDTVEEIKKGERGGDCVHQLLKLVLQ